MTSRTIWSRSREPSSLVRKPRPSREGRRAGSIPLTVISGPVHRGQITWRRALARWTATTPPGSARRRASSRGTGGTWAIATLDVGPGTGNFLARTGLPDASPVTLLDPNVNVLAHASRRLQNLDVTTIEADVLKPLPVDGPFDSAALNGVLHCLPGPLPSKAAAIANVAAVLTPGGILFGSSILGTSGRHTWLGRRILEANNRRGTFDNLGDTEEGLGEILSAWFERVELETVGTMAIFAAMNPRTKPSAGIAP